MLTLAVLIKSFAHLSYPGIFLYYCTVGYVVPLPEEVVLVVLGYLVGMHKFSFIALTLTISLSILVGDNFLYWVSRYESQHLAWIRKRIKPEMRKRYERLMENNLGKAMIISRLLVGVRFLSALAAGSLEVPWRKFFFYDLIISVAYVSTLLAFGMWFNHRLSTLINLVDQFHNLFLSLTILIVGVILLKLIINNYKKEE